MYITIRLLFGKIIIDEDNLNTRLLYDIIMRKTNAVFLDQIHIKCHCTVPCEFQSIGNVSHPYTDNEVLDLFITPIYSFPYIDLYTVSVLYQKHNTNFSNYPDRIIWINDIKGQYEISKWDSEKNHTVMETKYVTNEELRILRDSDMISPITKYKIEWILDEK